MDADSNVLVRGTDYVIRRLSSENFVELGGLTANIVANTVGYNQSGRKVCGQPITFVYESETGFELGIAQTTFNAPSSGIAYRTNRRFIPHALGSDTTTVYAYVNEEGTAFETGPIRYRPRLVLWPTLLRWPPLMKSRWKKNKL